MNYPFIKPAAAALAVVLAACGGGAGDGNDSGGAEKTPVSRSITAVPSLGVISNATLNIYKADGSSLLGTVDLAMAGQATVTFKDYFGPVVIEVAGNENSKYFDEAKNGLVSFPAGEKLHAIAPVSSGTFAVTTLTELAYQGAISNSYFPLDAFRVSQINERVRLGVIPEISDILAAPTAFTSSTTAGALANDNAGRYALKLAALAQLGKADASPALAILKVLGKDLIDGDIDGKDAANGSVSAPYSNFSTELKAKLTTAATSFGSADLKTALTGFAPLAAAIDLSGIPTGSADNAEAVGVFMSPAVASVARVPKDPVSFGTREDQQFGAVTEATWGNPGSSVVIKVGVGKFFSGLSTDWLTLRVEGEGISVFASDVSIYVGCEVSGPADSNSSCASAGITYNPSTHVIAFAGTKVSGLATSGKDFILTGSLRFGPVATATTTGSAGTTDGIGNVGGSTKPRVQLVTSMGNIVLELDRVKAPVTVDNFLNYVKAGHYDGTIFHRVISEFMIQGGGFAADLQAKSTGAPIKNEGDNGLKNVRGAIAMARTSDPHSATAQFFINVVDNDFLNYKAATAQGWGYAVFGEVVTGMEVVDGIRNVPTGAKGVFGSDVPKTAVVITSATVLSE